MLLQLREFIRREKMVSTQQLLREFSVDIQALLPMLQCWIKKGVIGQCENAMPCRGGCLKPCGKQVYYEFLL